jgi:hypothetical protein
MAPAPIGVVLSKIGPATPHFSHHGLTVQFDPCVGSRKRMQQSRLSAWPMYQNRNRTDGKNEGDSLNGSQWPKKPGVRIAGHLKASIRGHPGASVSRSYLVFFQIFHFHQADWPWDRASQRVPCHWSPLQVL